MGQFAISLLYAAKPSVLGVSMDMNAQELLLLTNQKRQEQGLPPLIINSVLTQAAAEKASDMFAKNYWAHNAPDGTTPWVFFKQAGYNYSYAGENLARGFTSSSDVINAWMASPTHRANVLSGKYNEVGFAIKQGKLLGEDTVLVVEMFGNTESPVAMDTQPVPIASQAQTLLLPIRAVTPPYNLLAFGQSSPLIAGIKTSTLIEKNSVSRNIAIMTLIFFISALIIDMIVVERKRIVRFVGHNLDHTLFLMFILLLVIVAKAGSIL